MILSDRQIKEYIDQGKIKVNPLPDMKESLGSSSLDLSLGNEFRVFNHTQKPYIDTKKPESFKDMTTMVKISGPDEYFVVQPGEFILGITREEVQLPDDLSARIDGRSSLGRLGIAVHSTAGHIDAGFRGRITLEISNIGMVPILLHPEMRVCHLVFEVLSSPAEVPYYKKKSAKYMGDSAPQESRLDSE